MAAVANAHNANLVLGIIGAHAFDQTFTYAKRRRLRPQWRCKRVTSHHIVFGDWSKIYVHVSYDRLLYNHDLESGICQSVFSTTYNPNAHIWCLLIDIE